MLRLLSIEFHKLKHNKATKVLTIIYFGLLASIALIAAIKFDFGVFKFHLAKEGIFNFPYIWHFNTYVAAIIKFFLLLVIVSMMANEYSYKTLKQNLIDGMSKKEFILSKFYTVLVFALVSTIFVFVVSLILGLVYSDNREIGSIMMDMDYLLAFFIKLTGFFSFGLFLGILIKRSAFAVGAMFVWNILEGIIYLILRWQIKVDDIVENIMQFFPLFAMGNLIKEPVSRLGNVKAAAKQIGQEFTKDYGVQYTDVFIVLVWTAIFVYLSHKLLLKRDL